MAAYDIEGTVIKLEDQQTFASGFTKRAFVIEVEDGKYPQEIILECLQDKVDMLEDVREGDKVKVKFDVRGRECKGRYFNNLVAWNVKVDGLGKRSETPPDAQAAPETGNGAGVVDDDDIPL